MSIESWKGEFLQEGYQDCKTLIEATEVSLHKWKGLRLDNLKKHSIKKKEDFLIDSEGYTLTVGSDSCSLCWFSGIVFFDPTPNRGTAILHVECKKCALGNMYPGICGYNCYYSEKDIGVYGDDAYSQWIDEENPEPMIQALEELLKKEVAKCSMN